MWVGEGESWHIEGWKGGAKPLAWTLLMLAQRGLSGRVVWNIYKNRQQTTNSVLKTQYTTVTLAFMIPKNRPTTRKENGLGDLECKCSITLAPVILSCYKYATYTPGADSELMVFLFWKKRGFTIGLERNSNIFGGNKTKTNRLLMTDEFLILWNFRLFRT